MIGIRCYGSRTGACCKYVDLSLFLLYSPLTMGTMRLTMCQINPV